MLKAYLSLTKTGIIVFALLSALTGYAVSLDIHNLHSQFDVLVPVLLTTGILSCCRRKLCDQSGAGVAHGR